MIALALPHANLAGESYHWGIDDYARRHPGPRWERVVVLPHPIYRPEILRRFDLRGLIAFVPNQAALNEVQRLKIPVVNLSASSEGLRLPTVTLDNRAIGKAAAEHFIERGYRHFAFVGPSRPSAFAETRGEGFIGTVRNALPDATGTTAWFGAPSPRLGDRVVCTPAGSMAGWLERLPKPLAIFAAHDALAAEVMMAAQVARLDVPRQVALLGVDDDPTVRDMAGPISSVRLPRRRVGYEAATLLDRLLDGRPLRRRIVLVPPGQVVTRASSDARAIDDEIVLRTMRLIDERARDDIDVGDIVRAIPLSRRALERRFLKVTGQTLKAQIQQRRIAYARQLLERTTMPIDEAARACGFHDRNRFFVAFRQATGDSPTAFRRRHRMAEGNDA